MSGQPLQFLDARALEVTDVGHRSAERASAQAQCNLKYLACGPAAELVEIMAITETARRERSPFSLHEKTAVR